MSEGSALVIAKSGLDFQTKRAMLLSCAPNLSEWPGCERGFTSTRHDVKESPQPTSTIWVEKDWRRSSHSRTKSTSPGQAPTLGTSHHDASAFEL